MQQDSVRNYGSTRERGANVSHNEIERAALDILAAGSRPSVEGIRAKIGRGSPATIANSLKRFWRDLGARAEGDPAALSRLPGEIAQLADGLWQRALALAAQAAKHDDNAARERLSQIRIENELRAQSFSLREHEFESAARARERALADSREHLLSTLRMLEADRQTLRAKEARIADLEAQVEDCRRELATIVEEAVARNRRGAKRKHASHVRTRPRLRAVAKGRASLSKPTRKSQLKRRSKK